MTPYCGAAKITIFAKIQDCSHLDKIWHADTEMIHEMPMTARKYKTKSKTEFHYAGYEEIPRSTERTRFSNEKLKT